MIKFKDLSIFLKIVVWAACFNAVLELLRYGFHIWRLYN